MYIRQTPSDRKSAFRTWRRIKICLQWTNTQVFVLSWLRSKTENSLNYEQRRGYRSLVNGGWRRDVWAIVTAAMDGGEILNVSQLFSVMCVANNRILLFSIPDEVIGFLSWPNPCKAGHGSLAVYDIYCLRSLGSLDRAFESHTRNGCLVCVCVYSVFVLSCV
jgi:hypothetical protein